MYSEAISRSKHRVRIKDYIYALLNRGYLRIKNENIEGAIEDIEQAYYIDKYCLTKYPEIKKRIPKGVKN